MLPASSGPEVKAYELLHIHMPLQTRDVDKQYPQAVEEVQQDDETIAVDDGSMQSDSTNMWDKIIFVLQGAYDAMEAAVCSTHA